MAKRELDPKLKELYNNNKKVYSISKLNTIDNCLYEAYRTYVLHEKGKNGVYGILGGKIHDVLEKIVNGEAKCEDLPDALEAELAELDMLNIDFPKDAKGGDAIRNNYIVNMNHFCHNFTAPKGRFKTEELVIYQVDEDRYLQGYIDLIRYNKNGSIDIYDWKTSAQFKKDELIHHGRQLVFYAMAKEAEGFSVNKVAWIMLKYCEVSFKGKKRSNSKSRSDMTKVVERRNLIKDLKQYILDDLLNAGYDECDSEMMLSQALKNNNFSNLPQEIQDNYKVKPYVREYELTDEIRQECLDYINAKADLFESLDAEDEDEWEHRPFKLAIKDGKEKEDIFYCCSLCNHRETCQHIKEYKEQRDIVKEDDEFADLF